MTGDEQAICLPFSNLDEAVTMLQEIGKRGIGSGASIVSLDFFTQFASPTFESSDELKQFLRSNLGIEHLVLVLGDKYAISTIKEMAEVTVDQDQAKIIMLGISKLYQNEGLELLSHAEGRGEPYKVLLNPDLIPLWEMILSPSPDNIAEAVDEDMKEFFRELYKRPEMTDLFWLSRFRPLSARQGRNHARDVAGFFCPMDNEVIKEICETLRTIGDNCSIRNDLGFIIPLEYGKRARIEWGFHYDQTDEQERLNAEKVQKELAEKTEILIRKIKGLRVGGWIMNQGFSRMESFLYT